MVEDDRRAPAREQVRAAFERRPPEPPVRTCRSCGERSATFRPHCPRCSKRFDRRLPWLSNRARWALAISAIVVAAGAVALGEPQVTESKRERADRERREQAQRVATERARLLREQSPRRGDAPAALRDRPGAAPGERLAARRAQVGALEDAILADVRGRIRRRQLDGPVRDVLCGPLVRTPDRVADDADLTKRRGRYDCVAVKRDVVRDGKVVGYFGHPFVATIDFARARYVWCKDNKLPGESGKPLAKVTLDRACLGAEGAARVGDGYVRPAD